MRPDTGQNSENGDFVIQREFNIMTQRAMILLQGLGDSRARKVREKGGDREETAVSCSV